MAAHAVRRVASSNALLLTAGLALMLASPQMAHAQGAGHWHTAGATILDSDNQPVRIAGVNWFGMETATFAPHGLWTRDYRDMMDQMSARLQHDPPAVLQPAVRRRQHAERHRLLAATEPRTCRAVQRPRDHGQDRRLRRRARPADHPRPPPPGRRAAQSALWYTAAYPEQRWITDWKMLAARYAGNPTVIGADLHNEPHGRRLLGLRRHEPRLAAGRRAGRQRDPGGQPELADLVEGVEQPRRAATTGGAAT